MPEHHTSKTRGIYKSVFKYNANGSLSAVTCGQETLNLGYEAVTEGEMDIGIRDEAR